MSILLKITATFVFLAGIVVMAIIWPESGFEYDACRHLSGSMSWISCLNGARTGQSLAQGMAIGYAVGGALLALLFYAMGHIIDQLNHLTAKGDTHALPLSGYAVKPVEASGDTYLDGVEEDKAR